MRTTLRLVSLGLIAASVSLASARAENGVTDTEVLLGESMGLTGAVAKQAADHLAGQNLYFKQLNAQGGVAGRKVRVITYDDGYDPARAAKNTQKLLQEDKVFALTKYYGTPTIRAALPLIEREDVPIIAPTSGGEFLRTPVNRNVFNVKAGYTTEATEMVNFLVKKRGLKRIGIFYQDDALGQEGRTGAVRALQAFGLTPVIAAPYKRNSEDLAAAVKSVIASKPEAILLWCVAEPAVKFYRLLKEANSSVILFGGSSNDSPEFAAVAEGAYMALVTPLPEPGSRYTIVQDFLSNAKAEHVEPASAAFRGYLDAAVLAEALKRAGRDLTRNALREAFEKKMTSVDIGGLAMHFSPTRHQGLENVFIGQVKGGKFVTLAE